MPHLSPLDALSSGSSQVGSTPAAGDTYRLARIGRLLGVLEPAWGFEVGDPGPPRRWTSPARVDTALADAWLREQDRRLGAGRAVAAAYLGWGLEYRLVNAVTAAMLTAPVMPLPSPEDTFLDVSPCGHADAVLFRAARVFPSAPGGGAERELARALVATMSPVIAAVRAVSGFPLAGLWGMVADSVASTAVGVGHRAGGCGVERCWGRAELVLEEMAAHGAFLRRLPRLTGPPMASPRLVRGTCCRYYASPEARDGPPTERWCSTCPAAPGNRGLPPAARRVPPTASPTATSIALALTGSHI